MTSDDLSVLFRRAQDDLSTADDAAAAAALIRSLRDPEDLDHALFVIGKAVDLRHRDLVASFLERPDDPMLSRLAIQILCDWWGLGAEYRREVLAFVIGVPWDLDDGGFVRSVALSSAGELARQSGDREVLETLFRVFDDDNEPPSIRRQAYSALARAAGKEWKDVPGTASDRWVLDPDTEMLNGLRDRIGRSD